MSAMKQFISGLMVVLLYTSMLAPFSITGNAQVIGRAKEIKMQETESGLTFKLREGTEGAEQRTVPEPAAADPLSEAVAGKLLSRLAAIKTDPDDRADFAQRVGTLPAPKAGAKIPVKFPADDQMNPPDDSAQSDGTLEVIRFSPEGDVGIAPDLNVTFSQPMVAVTSQDEAAKTVPVEFSPAVEGNWRWLGTRTLMFDTDKRFPMATKFTARVPAGTKSANGQTLAKDFTWTFTTPPPKIEQTVPSGGSTKRDAIIFIRFDQAIDQDAVLRMIRLTSKGKTLKTRLATEAEINSAGLNHYVNESEPGRWIAFRAVNANGGTENALPADSPITVTVAKGTPSAEGPLTTEKDQTFGFKTFGPMEFQSAHCGWSPKVECTPSMNWMLNFTNSINSAEFDKSLVTVTPAVEGLNIYPSANRLIIDGYKKGNTTYTVTVDGKLPDYFGQTLGKPAKATFKVGAESPQLYAQGGAMVVLDPSAGSNFSIYTINMNAVKVRLYKVEPKDFKQFLEYRARLHYTDDKKPEIPGQKVFDETVNIERVTDEMVETRLNLSPAYSKGLGNVIIDVEPVDDTKIPVTVRRYDPRIFVWAQSTKIGLDAFVDSTELVGWATELQTGKPLSGVEMWIHPNGTAPGTRISQNTSEESGFLAQAWDWIAGWGSAQTGIESFDENGYGVTTRQIEPAQSNTTGANGLLRLPLPPVSAADSISMLIAKRGNDTAFLPQNSDYYWNGSSQWYQRPESETLRWFVFDDRKMYKPNEEVAVKGYIRRITAGKLGDIAELGDAARGISYAVRDPRGNEVAKGTANINAFGAFDLTFKLPDNANLGYWNVQLETESDLAGDKFNHQFQVQEFRRPEFEVTAKVDSEAPHFVGGSADVSVSAKYYSGGGLGNAGTTWTVTARPTTYTPPNRDDFTFGSWVPWWRVYDYYGRNAGNSSTEEFEGVTDADGTHRLKIDFESANPPRPYTVTASAAVEDVNRQTWAGQTSLLVHPADLYVGIRTPRTFVQKGQSIKVESIVSDIDGNLVTGRNAEIMAVLKDWVFEKGSWTEKNIDEQVCTITSAETPQECSFVAKQGGRYIISAVVMDDRERFNESELTVWVPGGKTPPSRNVEQEEVQIIPSQKDFKPGDTAELLVISPFTPAEGVLTLRRDGIVKTEHFSMEGSSITLKIPLEEAYLPNIYAQVDLVGAAPRMNDAGEAIEDAAKRPAYATGNINLSISADSRKLTVAAEPRESTLAPGGETKIDIKVTGANGEAVANSEVAVVVVDESVLALTGYSISDPMQIFYTNRYSGTSDHHSRKDILLGNPEDIEKPAPPPPPAPVMMDSASAEVSVSARQIQGLPKGENFSSLLKISPGVANGESDESGTPINTRSNFDALAVFAPSVRTDAGGNATVDIKLPDNLTRYRITAVAVDPAKRFGKTESNITARQPLMVRPSAPRFLNFGDKFELPVVVQNQTDKDMAVDVAVRASNAKLTEGVAGKRVTVKANSREEVRFPVSTEKAGTARFQIAVSSGPHSDAAEISLPVWTPATTEAFATYGTTDKNGAIFQPVQTPGDVYPQFGGLEVTTSSTQLQELTDSFIYLYRYPFECSEQIASRMISIAALKDVLSAFKAKDMPSEAEIKASFDRDIKILQARQRSDGSFGMWTRDGERYTYPFLTVHVVHALMLAKAKGFDVPDDMLERSAPYLEDIEDHYDEWHTNPKVRRTISAYALYVRDLMGDKDAGKTKKLLAEAPIEEMPFEALGWILSVLADDKGSAEETATIVRFLLNRTTETAAAANFVTNYDDGGWLIMHSNRRADGVLLEALIKAGKNSETLAASANDLVPKLVRGLLAHRKKGHWGSTQDNVFILLALDRYFKAFESVTPDFVTKVWLGNVYAGEQKFEGRSIDSNFLSIPMSYLVEQGGTSNLILDKQGPGRLYYRIGMTYAPTSLKLEPADHGFTVLRKYEAVDDPADVKQNADGTWTFKAGARVRVRLTMVAQARRYHVALVDKLPAGLEILNPDLAVTEEIPDDDGGGNTGVVEFSSRSFGGSLWWRRNWFEHQNFRDERAEAFSSLLWAGVYNYTYVTRATTPGTFIVPPAKAEEMYTPETFGRTGTDFVTVE